MESDKVEINLTDKVCATCERHQSLPSRKKGLCRNVYPAKRVVADGTCEDWKPNVYIKSMTKEDQQ